LRRRDRHDRIHSASRQRPAGHRAGARRLSGARWESSYSIAAIIADPISRELPMSTTAVFAAFSVSLLVAALLGPRIGRTLDRLGGREVLAVSSLTLAAGLAIIAAAPNPAAIWAGWLVLGVGMGLGLYDAAFATLGRIYGQGARSAITGITLLGGLASTVGWPLTAWGVGTIGWRETCLCWALAHLIIGLPLNLLALPKLRSASAALLAGPKPHIPMIREMWLLGTAFACGWLVAAGMGAHLPASWRRRARRRPERSRRPPCSVRGRSRPASSKRACSASFTRW
jgi:MFS family permease